MVLKLSTLSVVVLALLCVEVTSVKAYIREVEWTPGEPAAGDQVRVTLSGVFGEGGFGWVRRDYSRIGGEIHIELTVLFGEICPQIVTNYRHTFDCGALPGGVYDLNVHLIVERLHNRERVVMDEQEYYYQLEIPGPAARSIRLAQGWNLVSLPMDPANHEIPQVFATLVENGSIRMVRDSHGRFYRPENRFNNIPRYEPREGYQVFATADCELSIEGVPVEPNSPISLTEGWNFVAYLPTGEQDVRSGFANIVQNLVIAKDAHGHFYSPATDFSNLPALNFGQAYQVKVRQGVDFVWGQP